MISLENIVSKIAAGGLSAGIFLFWWPEHVPGDGIEQLVLRGLLWTLTFELLLVSLSPFERIATAHIQQRTQARRAAVRQRLASAPAPARTGGALMLACIGLAGPIALLSGAPHEMVTNAVPEREVVKQVVVEKPVVKREVVVERVVVPGEAPPQQDAGLGARGATAASSASVRKSSESAKRRSTTKKSAAAKRPATEKAAPKGDAAKPAAPTAKAAPAPQPTTTAPAEAQATEPAGATTTPAPAADAQPAPAAPQP